MSFKRLKHDLKEITIMYIDSEFEISFVKQAIKVFGACENTSIIEIVKADHMRHSFSDPVEPGYCDGHGIRF
jgi:hypothetical protein